MMFGVGDRTVLTGSRDGSMILWDVATGEAIRRYSVAPNEVLAAIFAPDGQSFFWAARSGSGSRWELGRWRIDTLEALLTWTFDNRYVPELTCTDRAVYRLPVLCVDAVYPTRTPYVTPGTVERPTDAPAINPMPTPTLTPLPPRVAQLGDNRGQVPAAGVDRWLYRGLAGEILNLRVTADFPATGTLFDSYALRDENGNPTFWPAIVVRQSNGLLLGVMLTMGDNIPRNPVYENVELPLTGDYWIEVTDFVFLSIGGGTYTLTIERAEPEMR
ncbi:MAG: hypothetical protein HXY40_12145 [Chloroflexi bacterium]|nr:hypothetical protein [Chloroflexota bacterium]